MSKIVHLISGPRNISTALMYSFGNRSDFDIVDEPMYAVYLSKHNVDHPGRHEIISSMDSDLELVKQKVLVPKNKKHLFIKNMAHHFIGVDHSFIYAYHNIVLIRNPKQLITSFAKVIPEPTMQDIGLAKTFELYTQLKEHSTHPTIVLDSNEILKNPRKVLGAVCSVLDVPFSEDMIQWEAGPRDADGVWAKYWYKNVHLTTGFSKQRKIERTLPDYLEPLYEEAKTHYNFLFEKSIKA